MGQLLNRLQQKLKHRRKEAIAYFFNATKSASSSSVRTVIFAQGRTGSTLLESLLCSSGYFQRNGELLHPDRGEILFPTQFIRGLSKWQADNNFIFHVKVYQLTEDRKRPIDPVCFLETLQREGWKVIHLKRKNKVRHALSNVVFKHRGSGHKFDDRREDIKITVNCERFTEQVNDRIRFEVAEKEVLANIDYHTVVYEDDLEKQSAHQETANQIFDYLSLDRREVTTHHRKVIVLPLEELISNYDEFVGCLNQHGWQDFLD